VPSSRLSAIAVLGAAAIVLSGCAGEQTASVGVNELHMATLGAVTPSEQAFIDRMNQLSEGSVTLSVTDNWAASGGSDPAEVALTKAVFAGDVDIAWVTIRSLSAAGITGVDSLDAPLLVQSHDQQRAIANGVPGELITNRLRNSDAAALALLPGPTEYPVASDAPLLSAADWAGKTVQAGLPGVKGSSEAAGVQAFGATASSDGSGGVADVVSGAVQAATASPIDLLSAGATGDGPYLTANVALWPRMSVVLINRKVLDQLSNRQHGFVDGAVVRAQDVAMATPDLGEQLNAACDAGIRFGLAGGADVAALKAAAQPVYDALAADPVEAPLLEAIQEAVKKNVGTGAFAVSKGCRWKAPDA
jgi:TRAP-type C4-dicarboxylate transport system substrate-binding protein